MKAILSCINEVILAVLVTIHHEESVNDCFLKIPPFPFNAQSTSVDPSSLFSP